MFVYGWLKNVVLCVAGTTSKCPRMKVFAHRRCPFAEVRLCDRELCNWVSLFDWLKNLSPLSQPIRKNCLNLCVFFYFFLAEIKYLNGKLDDDTKYAVFQRSFDKDGNYEDEGFIAFTTKKDNTVAIVAGVVVAILAVVAIVIVVIIFYRKKTDPDPNTDKDTPLQPHPDTSDHTSGIGKLLYIRLIRFLSCSSHKLRKAPIDTSLVLKGPPRLNKDDLT